MFGPTWAAKTWFLRFTGSATIVPVDVDDNSSVSQYLPQQNGYRCGRVSGGSNVRDHHGRAGRVARTLDPNVTMIRTHTANTPKKRGAVLCMWRLRSFCGNRKHTILRHMPAGHAETQPMGGELTPKQAGVQPRGARFWRRKGLGDESAGSLTRSLEGQAESQPLSRRLGQVAMLLDNHYGPDPRVAFEAKLLEEAGIVTRIIAWDRRSEPRPPDGTPQRPEVVRVAVPAPSGGGWRSLVAMVRFGLSVWRRHDQLLEDTSVIVVHDVHLLPLGWALARRVRLPFVYDAHEEYARMEAARYPQWLLRIVTLVENRFARKAAAIVVPGRSRTRRWQGVASKAPIVLPNLGRRDAAAEGLEPPKWDIVHAGTIADSRRPDLLVELARLRPDLRIAIAGRGRGADDVDRAAAELPNLDYLAWRSDVVTLFEQTRAIYYGLDPGHPYSGVACPNTLYEAIRHRKPLIFFCGGEPAEVAAKFKIGIRCDPSVNALIAALEVSSATSDWEFDAAWRAVWEAAETQQYVEAVEDAQRLARR